MKRLAWIAAAALAGCSNPNRFDLACHLTQHIPDPKYADKVFDRTVRVDLTARQWCDTDCKELKPLKVTDSELVLEDHDGTDSIEGVVALHSRWRTAVNRRTGAYASAAYSHTGPGDIIEGSDLMATVNGTCAKKPFTSFPVKRF